MNRVVASFVGVIVHTQRPSPPIAPLTVIVQGIETAFPALRNDRVHVPVSLGAFGRADAWI